MDKLPLRAPVAVGANVTEMVQLAAAASVEPQVEVWAKSPVAEIPEIFNVAPPLLVNVTV